MEQLQLDPAMATLVEARCAAQAEGERARVLVSGVAALPWVEGCALWRRPRPGIGWRCIVSRGPEARLPEAVLVQDLAEGRVAANLVPDRGVVARLGEPAEFALAYAGWPRDGQELDALGALLQLFGLLSSQASSEGEALAPALPGRDRGVLGESDSSLAQSLRRWLQRRPMGSSPAPLDVSLKVLSGAEGVDCLLPSTELEHALELLLENARAAQETWSTRAWARLTLERPHDGDELCLSIDDGGPGLPPEIATALATQDPTRIPGDGLGLAVALAIVAAAGGRMEPGTNAEGGARLVLRLPRVPPT